MGVQDEEETPSTSTTPTVSSTADARLPPLSLQDGTTNRKKVKKQKANIQACPICDVILARQYIHMAWQHLEATCIDCRTVFDTPTQRVDHATEFQFLRHDDERMVA